MTQTQPGPAADEDPAAANTTAGDPGDGTQGVGVDEEVEPYVENPDHIPNPLFQSGVVDTSGVSGGLADVNQATPVFAQHRAAALRVAANEFADGVEDHVVVPDNADQGRRDAIGERLEKSAAAAEDDPRVEPEASEALAEELIERNAAPGAATPESASATGALGDTNSDASDSVTGTGADAGATRSESDLAANRESAASSSSSGTGSGSSSSGSSSGSSTGSSSGSSVGNDKTNDGTTEDVGGDSGNKQARSSEAAATTSSTTSTDPAGNVQTNSDADQTSKQQKKANS